MAGLESPRADGDPEGEAHQFSVGELHPWPFITVIEESLDTSGPQVLINRLGGGHRLLVVHLDNRDHHLVGAMLIGQIRPESSWWVSATAAMARPTPMP